MGEVVNNDNPKRKGVCAASGERGKVGARIQGYQVAIKTKGQSMCEKITSQVCEGVTYPAAWKSQVFSNADLQTAINDTAKIIDDRHYHLDADVLRALQGHMLVLLKIQDIRAKANTTEGA
jgi:hypothetical protein